jgi:hypothetical protein
MLSRRVLVFAAKRLHVRGMAVPALVSNKVGLVYFLLAVYAFLDCHEALLEIHLVISVS